MCSAWWQIVSLMAASILLALAQPGCGRPPAGRPVPVALDQIPDHILMVVAERWPQAAILQSSLYPQGVFELVMENLDRSRHMVRISLEGKVLADIRLKT